MRDLLPLRVFLAILPCRLERRFLADAFLPLSARVTLLRDALLRDELACLFFPNTVPEHTTVIRMTNMSAKRRGLLGRVYKFMRVYYLSWELAWLMFGQKLRYYLRALEVVRSSKLSESTRSSLTTRFAVVRASSLSLKNLDFNA